MSLLCLSAAFKYAPPYPLTLPPPFPVRVCKVTTHAAGVCVCVWHLHIVSILDLCQSSTPPSAPPCVGVGHPVCSFYANLQSANYTLLKVFLCSLSRLSDVGCVSFCVFVCVLVNGKLKNSIQSFLYSMQLLSHAPLNQQLFIYYVCVFLSLSLLFFLLICFSHFAYRTPFLWHNGPKESQPRCVSSPSTQSVPRGKFENVFFMHLLNGKGRERERCEKERLTMAGGERKRQSLR